MAGSKVKGKLIILSVVLLNSFLLAGFGRKDFFQEVQSPVSFYESILLSGEEAFFSGEYKKAIKELEIAAFGLFHRKTSAAKAYILMSLSYYHLEDRDRAGEFLKEAVRLVSEEELRVMELNIVNSDREILESLIQDFNVFSEVIDPSILEEDPVSLENLQKEKVKETPPPSPVKKDPEKIEPEKKKPETVDERIAQLVEQRKKQLPENLKEQSEVPAKKEAVKTPVVKDQEEKTQIDGLEELFLSDEPGQEQILSEIRIQKGPNSLDIGIFFQPYVLHQVFEITDIPPKRIVIDIHNIIGIKAGQSINIDDFGITSIRTGMFKTNIARVVFDAAGDLPAYKIERTGNGLRVVIEKSPF